jgi:hypothetical protein
MQTTSGLLTLLFLGAAVRLGLAWFHPSDMMLDSDGYLAHAEMVANGEGFAGPYTHRPTAFRPPAYPIALAGLRLTGLSASACVGVINGVCSLSIIWLTWVLSRQLQLPPLSAFFATAITAFDPLLIRYAILPMTEVPAAAMLLAAIVALTAGKRRSEILNNGVWRFDILAGILFGLGSLVRPILLVSCALLVLWRLMVDAKYSLRSFRLVAITMLPMIFAVLTLSPWIIRNAVQFGKFIPATTHGGYTLALGNNPDFYRDVINSHVGFPWKGPQLDAWQQRMVAESAAQGVPVDSEPAQDGWYYRQAVASIKAQPLSFLNACLLRLRRFWAITPGTDVGLPRLAILLVAVWYSGIGIGLVVGLGSSVVVGFKLLRSQLSHGCKAKSGLAELWLVVFSFMLMHSVYWTDARMRAPVLPLICILATFGWNAIIKFVVRIVSSRSPDDAGEIPT